MSRIKAEKVLAFCGFMTVVSALLVAMDLGTISKIGLFSCYAFEAIMFPTIFAITIARVDNNSVKIASSLLMMTPIGGAVGTLLMGLLADATSMFDIIYHSRRRLHICFSLFIKQAQRHT